MKLRGYFALVEVGAAVLPRAAVLARITPPEHAALRAAGLLRPGPERSAWPCDQVLACARAVIASAPGSAPPFVAHCEKTGDDDDRCPAVDLTAEDLVQERLALPDLAAALHRLYALGGRPPPAATLAPRGEPVLLGPRSDPEPARDVFLALAPGDATFPLFLALRERAARATLVLVPTTRRVTPELATRHAPGARVEIEILEDALVLTDGALALAPRLRLVPPSEEPPAPAPAKPARAIAAEIGATSWGEIKITVIDGHTLRIQKGQRAVRRTYLDLDLASKASREPTRKWALLLTICAGRGTFRWKNLGSFEAAKNAVWVLRKTLKTAFGLDEDPFHEFTVVDGWKARFLASSEHASDD